MEFKMMNEENVIGKSEKKVKFFEQKTIIYNEEEAEEEENSENSALFNKSGKNNDRVTRMANYESINNADEDDDNSNNDDGQFQSSNSIFEQKRGDDDYLLDRFESLDYVRINNEVNVEEEQNRGFNFIRRKQVLRWVVMFFIGVCTGLVAVIIDTIVEYTSAAKYSYVAKLMTDGMHYGTLWKALLFWIGSNCGLVAIASLLVIFVAPSARGSGIAQVKCYLNGIKIPKLVRFETLITKMLGVAFSVSGGLVVGKEGPMIHSGSIVAAGISQGLSTTFKCDLKIFKFFRSDTEKRDFVSGGAAAGVAAAFGSPVGGVLFSLEEGASFWNQSLTWRIFFASMISTFTLNICLSLIKGNFGDLSNPGLINFGKFVGATYKVYELPIFIIMGFMGGIFGAIFNHINIKLTKFRNHYIKKSYFTLLETMIVASMSAVIGFIMIYYKSNDCQPIGRDLVSKYPVQLFCDDGQYNAMSGLFFQTPEQSVRSLFHDPPGSFDPITLLFFCITYFILATWTYGLAIPSGLFIPSILIGAAWGRIVGILVNHLIPSGHIDPGKYALIGAAAMLGGILRMTLSLTVIVTEATGDITLGLPIMFAIMAAKWVGDLFNEGIFDMHIKLSGIPLINWDPPAMTSCITAQEVMSHPVVVVREEETVGRIYDILTTYKHNGFPVVEGYDPNNVHNTEHFGLLKGLILRHQLITLLKKKAYIFNRDKLTSEDFSESYPRYHSIKDVQIADEERDCKLDLRPYMNLSPYSLTEKANLPRIFKLFRGLGLRHLIIIDVNNRVVGIATRIDIAKYEAHVGLRHTYVKELTILQ